MLKDTKKIKKIISIIIIVIMCGIIFYFQTKKIGFHENEIEKVRERRWIRVLEEFI